MIQHQQVHSRNTPQHEVQFLLKALELVWGAGSACCANMRSWVKISRTHVKPGAEVHVCHPSMPVDRWEVETGESSEVPAHIVGEQQRDPVSNNVEGKDWLRRLSADLHTLSVTHANTPPPTYTQINSKWLWIEEISCFPSSCQSNSSWLSLSFLSSKRGL